jgi:4-hydroxybenzoate polyprenyltransferase
VALAFSGASSFDAHDREVRKQFMSVTTRYLVIAIVVVMLGTLAYAVLVRHDDLQSDIATGLSSTIAVAMLIYALMRKEK